MLLPFLFFLAAFLPAPARAVAEEAATVAGYWMTGDKDGVIEIYPCDGGKMCGRFHWLKDDSEANPSLDDKNRDPSLRRRPLCGLQFMGGFENEGNGKFGGGWIYSVRDGNTYSAGISLRDKDTLELRGYFLIPLLGQSRVWTRTGPEPACAGKPPLS